MVDLPIKTSIAIYTMDQSCLKKPELGRTVSWWVDQKWNHYRSNRIQAILWCKNVCLLAYVRYYV